MLSVLGLPAATAAISATSTLRDIDVVIEPTPGRTCDAYRRAHGGEAVSASLGGRPGVGPTPPTAAATPPPRSYSGRCACACRSWSTVASPADANEGLRRIDHYLEDLRAGRAPPEATGSGGRSGQRRSGLELFFCCLRAGPRRCVEPPGGRSARGRPGAARRFAEGAPARHGRSRQRARRAAPTCSRASSRPAGCDRDRPSARRGAPPAGRGRGVGARIVTAGYKERRRLERDLHDNAQQRLVSIGLALRDSWAGSRRTASRRRSSTPPWAISTTAIEEFASSLVRVRPAGPRRRARPGPGELGRRGLCRPGSRPPRSASRIAWRPCLLRRQRGAHQTGEARQGLDVAVSAAGATASWSSQSATTASAARSPPTVRGLPAWPTGCCARRACHRRSPLGRGTIVTRGAACE